MISLYSYFLTFVGVIFWLFRVVTTILFQLDYDFFATPINVDMEIVILFLTLPCLILVIKRNIVGSAAYLGIYLAYFGTALYESIDVIMSNGVNLGMGANTLMSLIGVIIPLLTFLDILLNKNRSMGKKDNSGNWFFNNESYTREHDSRDDINQYRL